MENLIKEIELLKLEIQNLQMTCLKLEAERDAHMEVIRQIFEIKSDSSRDSTHSLGD